MTEVAMQRFAEWLADASIDEGTKQELQNIQGNEKEIQDRFYRDLQFGTGGLRGVMGAGTNRMNIYTVSKATQGLANWINSRYRDPSFVIAHDSRNNSPLFALDSALVLAANGIRTYLFRSLRPTPQLSFSVRHLRTSGGVVITASHNPPEYNGYKAYDHTGCQLGPEDADAAIASIQQVTSFAQVKRLSQQEAESRGLLVWLDEQADQSFVQVVASERLNVALLDGGAAADLNIVYTPLHGAGNMPTRRVLAAAGFTNVHVVPEQEQPDGFFPTVKSPNPEERAAFTLAMEVANKVNADIIIGTDPDADRVGAVVRDSTGQFVVLTGNQSGAIMAHYVLSTLKQQGKLPANGVLIKTIVTSEMGANIAKSYGLSVENTLTGFKYIGALMNQYEQTGERTYVFGYEESYGYLYGTHARDKDAIVASLLLAEAAAIYKQQGKSLYDVLQELYEQYGTYLEDLESRTLKGFDGVQQIQAIMTNWRNNPPREIAGISVTQVLDYAPGLDGLPPENVLKYKLEDGSWFCLRPSGTEPKIKVYFAVQGRSIADAQAKIQALKDAVMVKVDR